MQDSNHGTDDPRMRLLKESASVEPNRKHHIVRHVLLTFALTFFLIFGMLVITDPWKVCDEKGGVPNVNGTWQLQYISERIAECKGEEFDLGNASAWLPWMCVLFFPFIMIQFHATYETIRGEIRHRREVNSRTRGNEGSPTKNSVTFKIPPMTPLRVSVLLLEALCVGGFFWLVFYNHTGPHRRWHGASTLILFLSATTLNIILCVVYYRYEARKDEGDSKTWKILVVNIIVFLQFCSVIAFFIAFLYQIQESVGDQDVAIALEYVVAVIWFITVVMDCFLYWFIRNIDHSPTIELWMKIASVLYVGLLFVGIGVIRLILLFVSPT